MDDCYTSLGVPANRAVKIQPESKQQAAGGRVACPVLLSSPYFGFRSRCRCNYLYRRCMVMVIMPHLECCVLPCRSNRESTRRFPWLGIGGMALRCCVPVPIPMRDLTSSYRIVLEWLSGGDPVRTCGSWTAKVYDGNEWIKVE